MQELIAEVIEATKKHRELRDAAHAIHLQCRKADEACQEAYSRVTALRARMNAEINAAAGYTHEEVEQIERYT